VKRWLGGLAGALGLVALWRMLRREPAAPDRAEVDPADELRARLDQARETADDRDDFDAAEGQPVDEVGEPRSLEERRRAIHEQAQETLGEMNRPDGGE
jgi:hypothetical protein